MHDASQFPTIFVFFPSLSDIYPPKAQLLLARQRSKVILLAQHGGLPSALSFGVRIPGTGYRSHLIMLACPLLCRSPDFTLFSSFLAPSLSAPSLSSHALLFHGPPCCLFLLLLLHPLLPAQLRLRSAHLKSLSLKPSLSL